MAHFSLRFPNYLKACYRLTTCLPSFPTFYGIYSAWASSTFGTLLLISRNRFGSTNFSTAFRLRFFFFLVSFLSCFLCHFLSYFLDLFSILSHSPPPSPAAPPLLQTRGNDHFVLLQTITSTIPPSWLTQKVRAALWPERLCTDWRFSVMETLAVILNCRWQVKRLKVPFSSVWKENFVFSAPPKKLTKNRETK